MTIRKANIDDIDNNLLNLYIEGFNMHYEKRKDIFESKNNDELRNSFISTLENEIVLVIKEDETIIGYAAFQYKNRKTKSIWIDEMIIDKKYQNKGYGKKLLEEIFRYAKDNNCKRVELNCWAFNEDAIRFYDRLGFTKQRIVYEKEVDK